MEKNSRDRSSIFQPVDVSRQTDALFCPSSESWAYQVSEVIAVLSGHEPAGIAKPSDILDVGLQAGRVGLQDDVDKGGQEVVRRGWLVLGGPDGGEDVLAAAGDAGQLVPRDPL